MNHFFRGILAACVMVSHLQALNTWKTLQNRFITTGKALTSKASQTLQIQKSLAESQFKRISQKPTSSDIAARIVHNFFTQQFNQLKIAQGLQPSLTWLTIDFYPLYKDSFIQNAAKNFGSMDTVVLFKLLHRYPAEASLAFTEPAVENLLTVNPAILELIIRKNPQSIGQFIHRAIELIRLNDQRNRRLLQNSGKLKLLQEYADAEQKKLLEHALSQRVAAPARLLQPAAIDAEPANGLLPFL